MQGGVCTAQVTLFHRSLPWCSFCLVLPPHPVFKQCPRTFCICTLASSSFSLSSDTGPPVLGLAWLLRATETASSLPGPLHSSLLLPLVHHPCCPPLDPVLSLVCYLRAETPPCDMIHPPSQCRSMLGTPPWESPNGPCRLMFLSLPGSSACLLQFLQELIFGYGTGCGFTPGLLGFLILQWPLKVSNRIPLGLSDPCPYKVLHSGTWASLWGLLSSP